jgi:hypothetical protein
LEQDKQENDSLNTSVVYSWKYNTSVIIPLLKPNKSLDQISSCFKNAIVSDRAIGNSLNHSDRCDQEYIIQIRPNNRGDVHRHRYVLYTNCSWSRQAPIDQHGTKIFCNLHPGSITSASNYYGASFLGQTTIRTRQILLGFYPSVQKTSQFMSHDWELTSSLHGKSIAIRIFLSKLLKIWPEQCGWEWRGYIQYMPYLASWRYRRCSTITAVPRQSFVIHPNGGWWQSIRIDVDIMDQVVIRQNADIDWPNCHHMTTSCNQVTKSTIAGSIKRDDIVVPLRWVPAIEPDTPLTNCWANSRLKTGQWTLSLFAKRLTLGFVNRWNEYFNAY